MSYHPERNERQTSQLRRAGKAVSAAALSDYRKDPLGFLLWITLALTVACGLFGRHVTWEVHVTVICLAAAKIYRWYVTEGFEKPLFALVARRKKED